MAPDDILRVIGFIALALLSLVGVAIPDNRQGYVVPIFKFLFGGLGTIVLSTIIFMLWHLAWQIDPVNSLPLLVATAIGGVLGLRTIRNNVYAL